MYSMYVSYLQIRDYLMSSYESLKMAGLSLEYFPVRNVNSDKINESAKKSEGDTAIVNVTHYYFYYY